MVTIHEREFEFADDERPRVHLPIEAPRQAGRPEIKVATPDYITVAFKDDWGDHMVTVRVKGRKFITAELIRHGASCFILDAELVGGTEEVPFTRTG